MAGIPKLPETLHQPTPRNVNLKDWQQGRTWPVSWFSELDLGELEAHIRKGGKSGVMHR